MITPSPSTERFLTLILLAGVAFALLAAACGTSEQPESDDSTSSPTSTPTEPAAEATATPTSEPMEDPTATPDDGGGTDMLDAPAGGIVAQLQEGAIARYKIREELASVPAPFDATGETMNVSGAFTFTADGGIVPAGSRIVLDATSLRSDDTRRDRFLEDNAIQTTAYPEIVFVATDTEGLAWPMPSSGEAEFTIHGDLTVRNVTRPVSWQTVATFSESSVTGTATTNFTFGEFEMEVPDLFFIVSLEDNIRLELDFTAAW